MNEVDGELFALDEGEKIEILARAGVWIIIFERDITRVFHVLDLSLFIPSDQRRKVEKELKFKQKAKLSKRNAFASVRNRSRAAAAYNERNPAFGLLWWCFELDAGFVDVMATAFTLDGTYRGRRIGITAPTLARPSSGLRNRSPHQFNRRCCSQHSVGKIRGRECSAASICISINQILLEPALREITAPDQDRARTFPDRERECDRRLTVVKKPPPIGLVGTFLESSTVIITVGRSSLSLTQVGHKQNCVKSSQSTEPLRRCPSTKR
jgi:hypothetical protein